MQGNHVQTVIKVLSEVPGLHFGFQVTVGGRHNAHIHLFATAAAHAFDFLFLEHAQNLHLKTQLHLADFIQKMVPPSASSKRPGLERMAWVKAPFSCPKSSLSSNSLGMAPQLMGTKGLSARRLLACRARTSNSLPVPDSPVTSTVLSVGADFAENFEDFGQRGALADNAACI